MNRVLVNTYRGRIAVDAIYLLVQTSIYYEFS
jgi:hypothetical protein